MSPWRIDARLGDKDSRLVPWAHTTWMHCTALTASSKSPNWAFWEKKQPRVLELPFEPTAKQTAAVQVLQWCFWYELLVPFLLFYIKDASFTVAEVNWLLIYLLFCAYYFFPENFGLVNLIKSYKHNNNSSIYRCLDNLQAVIFGDPASDSPLLLYSYEEDN